MGNGRQYNCRNVYGGFSEKYNFSLDEPLENLPKETIDKILYGTGDDELTINKNRFTAEVLISINLRV